MQRAEVHQSGCGIGNLRARVRALALVGAGGGCVVGGEQRVLLMDGGRDGG